MCVQVSKYLVVDAKWQDPIGSINIRSIKEDSIQIIKLGEWDPIYSSMTAALSDLEQQVHENWMR